MSLRLERRDGERELDRDESLPRDLERDTMRDEGLPRGACDRPRGGEGVRLLDNGDRMGDGLGILSWTELRRSKDPERGEFCMMGQDSLVPVSVVICICMYPYAYAYAYVCTSHLVEVSSVI